MENLIRDIATFREVLLLGIFFLRRTVICTQPNVAFNRKVGEAAVPHCPDVLSWHCLKIMRY